jgi:hypothetical protein
MSKYSNECHLCGCGLYDYMVLQCETCGHTVCGSCSDPDSDPTVCDDCRADFADDVQDAEEEEAERLDRQATERSDRLTAEADEEALRSGQ